MEITKAGGTAWGMWHNLLTAGNREDLLRSKRLDAITGDFFHAASW
jgi:hypothetical protein